MSTRQQLEDSLVDEVRATLAVTGLDPGRLMLEITETSSSRMRRCAFSAPQRQPCRQDSGTGHLKSLRSPSAVQSISGRATRSKMLCDV